MCETLRVAEIYLSLQGEGRRAGLPCTLVRLAGCDLRCAWCDTPKAQDPAGGEEMTVGEVLDRVAELGCGRVELTGGEPLLQAAAPALLRRLCDGGFETLLETNGARDIGGVDPRVARIVDVKCPSSGHADATRWANVECLTRRDEVKFVLADRADYEFARAAVADRPLRDRCEVIFSCVAGRLEPRTLAEWVLADGLDVRVGVQLHRIIWPDRVRGV